MSEKIKTSLIIVFLTVILSSLDVLYYQKDVIRYLIELEWLFPMGLLSGSVYLFWTRIIVPFIDDYLPNSQGVSSVIKPSSVRQKSESTVSLIDEKIYENKVTVRLSVKDSKTEIGEVSFGPEVEEIHGKFKFVKKFEFNNLSDKQIEQLKGTVSKTYKVSPFLVSRGIRVCLENMKVPFWESDFNPVSGDPAYEKKSKTGHPTDFDVRKVFEGTLDDGREIEIFFKHNQIGDFWVEEVIKNDEPLVKIGIKETGRLLYLKTEKPDLELYQRVKDHLGMIVFDSPDVVGDLSVFIKKLGHEVQLMNSTTV